MDYDCFIIEGCIIVELSGGTVRAHRIKTLFQTLEWILSEVYHSSPRRVYYFLNETFNQNTHYIQFLQAITGSQLKKILLYVLQCTRDEVD